MKNLIKPLLKIRVRQFRRELMDLGILYSALLILAGGFVLYMLWQSKNMKNYDFIILALTAGLCFIIQQVRKDHHFLKLISTNPWKLRSIEYLILSLPFFLMLLLSKNPLLSFLIVPACILTACNPASQQKSNSKSPAISYIPYYLFEWRSGLRKAYFAFQALYYFSFILLPFSYISLLLIWIISSIIISFYQECEPADVLQLTFKDSPSLFKNKIYPALKYFWLFTVPQLGLYCIIHPSNWVIPLILSILLNIVFIFSIVSKYAYYKPNQEYGPSSIQVAISHISIFIPFLVPYPLIKTFLQLRKAKKNIQFYTNA